MTSRRIWTWAAAALLALALALAATACGGTSTSASGGGTDGAAVVPADSLAYVAINSDLSSSQWKTVDGLLNKFPGKDELLSKLRASFEKDTNANWETDVKPALGKEIDVAVFGAKPYVVGLTQPADKGKFDALVKKLNASDSGNPAVTADVSGWTVIADTQAAIDAFKQASSGSKLADDATFKDAMSTLSDDALVKAYANGAKVVAALTKAAGPMAQNLPKTITNLQSGAAELVAADNGLKLDGTLKSSGGETLKAYTPKLVDKVPTGALAFLSFKGIGTAQLTSIPMVGVAFGAVIQKLGTILANENAVYVRPGTPIPEVTLVATPDDPQAAVTTVTGLLKQFGAKVGDAGGGVQEANFGRFSVFYGVVDGDFIATDSKQGLSDFKNGTSLTDDPTYKEAVSVSGMPGQTTGFLYVNLKDAVPLVESLAQLSGSTVPPVVSNNLAPLRTLMVYGTGKSGEIGFTAFLEVK
jgi:hypothetical protein